ncbi:single-stranded-DNA-specific exonuclease RecJ [Campylobacter sp. MOP7]|uniref:single-stranded-DNA-specific exonuclease RecJ n=1 Tax=Campylobacter canis TaxID=3378588 RepID=UPI00387E2D65
MSSSNSLIDRLREKLEKQTESRGLFALKDIPHPFSFKNNQKAAKRIIENICAGKKMLIIGDYDADGIMATTILMEFFEELGFGPMVDYRIPSRLKDGYGLNKNLIDYALDNGFDFCLTVDNGIAATQAIDYANEKGIEVIITDHHTPPAVLPNTGIIVNPRCDENLEFQHISGATVAWYLAYAIQLELGTNIKMAEYLDYVAITIVSDVMPLVNINVPMLNYGIELIKKQKRPLYKLLWNNFTLPVLDSIAIAFSLVPMINAVGRIDDANKAVALFLEKDNAKIYKQFLWLKATNETRKEMSRKYLKEALDSLGEIDLSKKAIVVKSNQFHEGLVGIIAGKLAERYHKPAYVLTYSTEKRLYKGSGRSSGSIHLYDLTNRANSVLAGFGGHSGAVGLAVTKENFDEFERIVQEAASKFQDHEFLDNNKEPIEIELHEINEDVMNLIDKFMPYGACNPQPIFSTKANVQVAQELKGGLHYKCAVNDAQRSFTGLFFNVESEKFLADINCDKVDIRFTLSKNYNLQLNTFSTELLCEII